MIYDANKLKAHAEIQLRHSVNPIYTKELSASYQALTGGLREFEKTSVNAELKRTVTDIRKLQTSTVQDLTEADESELVTQVLMNAYVFSRCQEAAAKTCKWVDIKEDAELNFIFTRGQFSVLKAHFNDIGAAPKNRIPKSVEIANSKKSKDKRTSLSK